MNESATGETTLSQRERVPPPNLLSLCDGIPALSGDWPRHLRHRRPRPGPATIHYAGIASNLDDLPRIRRTRGPRDILRGSWTGRRIHRGSTESGGRGGRGGSWDILPTRLGSPNQKDPTPFLAR